jgi:hypothetical protein
MHCLGQTPLLIHAVITEIQLEDLKLGCDNGEVIEALQSLSLQDEPLRDCNCDKCVAVDFSECTARSIELLREHSSRETMLSLNGRLTMVSRSLHLAGTIQISKPGSLIPLTKLVSMKSMAAWNLEVPTKVAKMADSVSEMVAKWENLERIASQSKVRVNPHDIIVFLVVL